MRLLRCLPESPSPAVFDLSTDPGEQQSPVTKAPAWIERMRARHEPLRETLGHQIEASERADIDPGLAEHLKALGYAESPRREGGWPPRT